MFICTREASVDMCVLVLFSSCPAGFGPFVRSTGLTSSCAEASSFFCEGGVGFEGTGIESSQENNAGRQCAAARARTEIASHHLCVWAGGTEHGTAAIIQECHGCRVPRWGPKWDGLRPYFFILRHRRGSQTVACFVLPSPRGFTDGCR